MICSRFPAGSLRFGRTDTSKMLVFPAVLLIACLAFPHSVAAQFDLLRNLFGSRRPVPRIFEGEAQLEEARRAVERGDVKESLELVRKAMAKGAAQFPLNDPIGQSVAVRLIALSHQWDEQHADAATVAAVLREIVLPADRPSEIWPYALSWQPESRPWSPLETRLSRPHSVAAEMVKWSVRAKLTMPLLDRLQPALKAPGTQSIAEVIAVQLATVEHDEPVANRLLNSLRTAVGKSPMVDEWMLHAVTPALDDAPTQFAGLQLMEAVLASIGKPDQGTLGDNRFAIQVRAVPLYFQLNRSDEAVRLAVASANLPISSQRYGREFAELIQQLQRSQAAAALLNGHRVVEALDVLAARVDAPPARNEMYYPSFNIAAMLGRELQKLPAEERYELLHKWVMPDTSRTKFRELSEYVSDHTSIKTGAATDRLLAGGIHNNIYSTAWHLTATARELGRLDELIGELSKLSMDDPAVSTWQVLALVVRDGEATNPGRVAQTTQRLATLVAETTANVPKWEDNPKRPFPILSCVVALEAARFPQWSTAAEELLLRLIEHSQRLQWDRPRGPLRMAWAEVQRRRSAGAKETPSSVGAISQKWHDLQPRHWIVTGDETAVQHAGGSTDNVWVAHENSYYHLTGRYDSSLFFQYPLTGDFQITMQVREGGWSEGGSGYGGVAFATNGYNDRAPLHAPGRTNFLMGPPLPNLLHRNPWNQQTIEVRNGQVQYRANGQLIHEDHPGASSPWLCLNADWGRTPIFRNVRFTGQPTIPTEIPLLSDHRLRGWVANTYSETRDDPLRATSAIKRRLILPSERSLPMMVEQNDSGDVPTEFVMATDWYWEKDELHSPQRTSFFPAPIPSRLYYQRPMQAGETVEYQFFSKAGEVEAHPTVGRTLFVLESKRVIIRPVGDGDVEVRDLAAEEIVVPHEFNIRHNDWNQVRVSMTDDRVQITLNNDAPFEFPLAKSQSSEFGFWHDAAKTSLRVRQVTLRGDWPQKFTDEHRAAIERPQPVSPPEPRQFLTNILREEVVADNAYAVYQQALRLDGEARYVYLYRWVMPGPDHDTLRTVGALTPTHPSPLALPDNPIDVATAEARQAFDPRRVQTGGSFVCPAVLLVFSALELGRLGELSDALDHPGQLNTPAGIRARAAMHGMIALLEDRIDQATAALWDGNRLLLEGGSLPQHERWSEPALCSLAILHPDTRDVAFELIDRIQRRQLQAGQPGISEFGRYVRQLHGQALFLLQAGDPAVFGTQPRLKQWQGVSQSCARTRGAGDPIASFDSLDGELSIRGGHDFDMAYFQSPLRGSYEVRMRLTQFDYRELMPLVGGVSSVVRFDNKNMKLQSIRSSVQEMVLDTDIAQKAKSWADYRVVVKDNHYTAYVNNQKFYEQDLPPNCDPWVAIQGWAGQSSRSARDVVITGTPEIPRELDLLAPPEMQGWLADYYGTAAAQSPYPWQRENEVMLCPQVVQRGAVPGQLKIENIIRYHRPMLEDGVVAYEFYYDPDAKIAEPVDPQRQQFLNERQVVNQLPGPLVVHPALDRMVCLLEPNGVKIHWLTDGRYDRTGVLPDNVTTIPNPKPLPLKSQAWNAVQFCVTGDELSIMLNGEMIFRHAIEPTNQRQFGFFHYVNESTAKVRNVRYRGEWPLKLPAVKDQELATGPERNLNFTDAELPALFSFDFTKMSYDPKAFRYMWDEKIALKCIRGTPDGVRMTFPVGEVKGATTIGISPRVKIKGDFVMTADFTQFKTVPVKEAWGCGMSLNFKMTGLYGGGIDLRQTTNGKGLNSGWQVHQSGNSISYFNEGFDEFPEEGRLRLARRGVSLYYLFAKLNSDDFRLLTVRPLGTADMERVGVHIDCSDAAGGSELLLKKFEIRAQELVPIK